MIRIEKEFLHRCRNHNKTKASEILGISRVNLIAKIKKYLLEQPHHH